MTGEATPRSGALRARRLLPFVVWGSIALGILALVLSGDIRAMTSALVDADPRLVALLLVVALILPVVHARRWQVMLRSVGHDLSLGAAVDLTISSTMINYAAPGYLWSPAKGMLARQMYGVGLGRSVPTLAAEQVLDALALLLGTAAGLLLAGPTISRQIAGRVDAPSAGTLLIAAGALALVLIAGIYAGFRFGRRFVRSSIEAGRLLAGDRSLRAPVIGLTAARWLLDTLAIWLAAKAVGVSLGFSALILISNLPLLVGVISPMPGGIGFREGAMAAVASALVIPVAAILAAAILHRAVLILALPLVAGLIRVRRWARA
ncbi:MAG TPA: lysylphosphatidylglycerol synthase transmembrane domain-containing protein [Nitrolancea sp.]